MIDLTLQVRPFTLDQRQVARERGELTGLAGLDPFEHLGRRFDSAFAHQGIALRVAVVAECLPET